MTDPSSEEFKEELEILSEFCDEPLGVLLARFTLEDVEDYWPKLIECARTEIEEQERHAEAFAKERVAQFEVFNKAEGARLEACMEQLGTPGSRHYPSQRKGVINFAFNYWLEHGTLPSGDAVIGYRLIMPGGACDETMKFKF